LESDSHMIRETKLNNLVVRLTAWGKACGLHDPNRYDRRLESPDLRPHLEKTLRCIAEQLIDRKLRQHSDDEREYPGQPMIMSWLNLWGQWRGLSGHHEHIPPDGAVPASGQATTQRQGITETMLDNLLRDLREFIEDLEAMTRRLGISRRQRNIIDTEIESISDIMTLRTIESARVEIHDPISDSASQRLSRIRGSSHREPSIAAQSSNNSGSHTFFTARTQLVIEMDNAENPEALSSQVSTHFNVPGLDTWKYTRSSDLEPATESSMEPQHKRTMAGILSESKTLQINPNFDGFSLAKWLASREAETPLMRRNLYSFCRAKCLVNERSCSSAVFPFPCKDVPPIAYAFDPLVADMNRQTSYFTIVPVNDNLLDLIGTFEGPPGTPYQGGIFQLSIEITSFFPFRAPKCRFLTMVYHPNIDANGKICLDILDDYWYGGQYPSDLVVSIRSLLGSPNLEEPLVPEIAEVYLRHRDEYDETARRFTRMYAMKENSVIATKSEIMQDPFNSGTLSYWRVRNLQVLAGRIVQDCMEGVFTDLSYPHRIFFEEPQDLTTWNEVALALQHLAESLSKAQQTLRRLGALLDRTRAGEGADYESFSVIHVDIGQAGLAAAEGILSKWHSLQPLYCLLCRSEEVPLCLEHRTKKFDAYGEEIMQFALRTASELNNATKNIERYLTRWNKHSHTTAS
jgi:ubiquitin-conjugating enzyme E2 D